jgi:hypothetical protein
MEATETISWVRVTELGEEAAVCHYCAVVATDLSMTTELVEQDNELARGERLNCEVCGVLIAHGPRL